MTWAKLKEKIEDHIVTLVLSLVALLCLVIWRAVPDQAWEQLGAVIPKRALAALIALSVIGLSTAIAYIYSLRKRLRLAPAQTPTNPYLRYSGILWDAEDNPYCPICETLMHLVTSLVKEEEEEYFIEQCRCPKCGIEYPLQDKYGSRLGMHNIRANLQQKRMAIEQNVPFRD